MYCLIRKVLLATSQTCVVKNDPRACVRNTQTSQWKKKPQLSGDKNLQLPTRILRRKTASFFSLDYHSNINQLSLRFSLRLSLRRGDFFHSNITQLSLGFSPRCSMRLPQLTRSEHWSPYSQNAAEPVVLVRTFGALIRGVARKSPPRHNLRPCRSRNAKIKLKCNCDLRVRCMLPKHLPALQTKS